MSEKIKYIYHWNFIFFNTSVCEVETLFYRGVSLLRILQVSGIMKPHFCLIVSPSPDQSEMEKKKQNSFMNNVCFIKRTKAQSFTCWIFCFPEMSDCQRMRSSEFPIQNISLWHAFPKLQILGQHEQRKWHLLTAIYIKQT